MLEAKPIKQLDLFAEVVSAYASNADGVIDNRTLYSRIAEKLNLPESALTYKEPVGRSKHNLLTRKIRWHQQTLKHAGLLQKVGGKRGVWEFLSPVDKSEELNQIDQHIAVIGFSTNLGIAILGWCDTVFAKLDSPIHLVVTSPPYPLAKARGYGNPKEHEYVDWICKTIEPIVKNLVSGGSICLNVGNDIFIKGSPARSIYKERLVIALHERLGLYKMDEIIWHNPSKPPGPVEWASKKRVQLNVSFEPVIWLTNDPSKVRSDNRRVLLPHTEKHLKFVREGGVKQPNSCSDGAYTLRAGSYGHETPGRIPRNVLTIGHSCKDQLAYKRAAKENGIPSHGAAMPLKLASFLIEFLTAPGEVVVDPFAGSFTTAKAAELLGRRWIATERIAEYVIGSAFRFSEASGFHQNRMVA